MARGRIPKKFLESFVIINTPNCLGVAQALGRFQIIWNVKLQVAGITA